MRCAAAKRSDLQPIAAIATIIRTGSQSMLLAIAAQA
jgi:hypothetical protein